MLSITLVCVGKMRETYYISAFAEYAKRLGAYCRFDLVELPEQRLPERPSQKEIHAALEKEAQAIRAVLPALGNEFIVLLKDTSLITVIGGKELLYAAQGIMNRTYEAMFPLLGVAVVYLILVMIFTWLLSKFERRMAQGDR